MRTSSSLLGTLAVCGLLAVTGLAEGIDRLDLQDATVPQDAGLPPAPSMSSLPPSPAIPDAGAAVPANIPEVKRAFRESSLNPLAPPPWVRPESIGSSANIPVSAAATSSRGIQAPRLQNPSEIKKPRISQPNFEEDYRRWMLQEQAKKAQRKRLGESIMDEIKRYGLLILLGFVAILVLFALKKESAPTPPPSGAGNAEGGPAAEPKDIWKDGF